MNIRFRPMTHTAVVSILAMSSLTFFRPAPAEAKYSCDQLPGFIRCGYWIDPERAFATPPEPQKMSLWCWAASLSMAFKLQGHPSSKESIVVQNFGTLVNAPSGPFPVTVARMNRVYIDDMGKKIESIATPNPDHSRCRERFARRYTNHPYNEISCDSAGWTDNRTGGWTTYQNNWGHHLGSGAEHWPARVKRT
jgi:hypothetical protein